MAGRIIPFIADAMVRAPTKTLAFTGAANLGQAATASTIWTITGRVLLIYGTAFCTETVVSTINLGTIALGTATATGAFISAHTLTAGDLANGDWWGGNSSDGTDSAGPSLDWVGQSVVGGGGVATAISENIIVSAATQDITDGTLVFDCFYLPLTAGAGLA